MDQKVEGETLRERSPGEPISGSGHKLQKATMPTTAKNVTIAFQLNFNGQSHSLPDDSSGANVMIPIFGKKTGDLLVNVIGLAEFCQLFATICQFFNHNIDPRPKPNSFNCAPYLNAPRH
jgi:hypothetical protein